jgi:hypothetical protein
LLQTRYAEDGDGLPPDLFPVFVTVLKAKLPGAAALQAEAAQLTMAVARTCGRAAENVHVIYQPAGAGRVAFGGEIVAE